MYSLIMVAWNVFLRDYKVRFRRTFLGIFWYLAPVLMLAGAAMFFGLDLGLYSSETRDIYIVKLIAGLIVWQLFADSWSEPLRFGRRTRTVLRSVILNQNALLMAGVISALAGFVVKLPILAALFIFVDILPSLTMLYLPLGMISVIFVGIGIAGFTLPLSLNILDMRYALPVLQLGLLLSTPIFYERPETGIMSFINQINPFTYLVPPVRDMFLGANINFWSILTSSVFAFIFLSLAIFYFHQKIRLAIAYIGR